MIVVVVVTRGDRIQLEEEDEAVQASRPSWTFALHVLSVIDGSGEADLIFVDSCNAFFGTLSITTTTTDHVVLRLLLLRSAAFRLLRWRLHLLQPRHLLRHRLLQRHRPLHPLHLRYRRRHLHLHLLCRHHHLHLRLRLHRRHHRHRQLSTRARAS